MEEADVLCSRIGIVSKGKLKCIGNYFLLSYPILSYPSNLSYLSLSLYVLLLIQLHYSNLSIGSQQHLKSKFGKGFKIQLSFDISFQDKIDQYITSLIPSAVLVGDYWGKKSKQIANNNNNNDNNNNNTENDSILSYLLFVSILTVGTISLYIYIWRISSLSNGERFEIIRSVCGDRNQQI